MSGEDLGFMVTTKAVTDKVLYTAGDTVSWRMPRVPQPRLDWTEAAFELSFKLTSAMVLYVGVPTMGGIVGNGKTIHDIVDGGWHGDILVLTTDNTSKIERRH